MRSGIAQPSLQSLLSTVSACSDDKTDNKTDNTDRVRMCPPMSPFCSRPIISNYILAQIV